MASIAHRIHFPNQAIDLKGFQLPKAVNGIPQPHIIGAFVGQSGSGKTTACVNFMERVEAQGLYDVMTLISPTGTLDRETNIRPEPKWGLIDFTETFGDYSPAILNDIISTQKGRIIAFRKYLEALGIWKQTQDPEASKKLQPWQWIFLNDETSMERPTNPNPSGRERYPTQMVILDDVGQMSQHDKLMNNFVTRSRHNNASIVACVQYMHQLPRVLRKQLNMIAVFKSADAHYLAEIFGEFASADMTQETFQQIMQALPSRKDFLLIDLKESGNHRYRVNFDTFLSIDSPGQSEPVGIIIPPTHDAAIKRKPRKPKEEATAHSEQASAFHSAANSYPPRRSIGQGHTSSTTCDRMATAEGFHGKGQSTK